MTEDARSDAASEQGAADELAVLASKAAHAGFEAVFARHGDEVFRLCCALVGSEAGKRAFRRVAKRAATALGDGELTAEPRNWLLRLASETAVAQEGRPEEPEPAPDQTRPRRRVPVWKQAAEPPPQEPTAASVASLGRTERAGLLLRESSGLPYPEIAGILGIDEANLRESVTQARRTLQPQLPREGPMCEVARGLMADDDRTPAASEALSEHLATCEQCPKVQASASGIAAAVRKAFPKIAPTLLLAVLREAAAHAAEPPGGDEPDEPRRDLRRHLTRQAALVAVGAVLLAALALGLGARSVENPTAVLSESPPRAELAMAGFAAARDLPCPSGTTRVFDHCEPEFECPDWTRRIDAGCVVDPECFEVPRRPELRCPRWVCPPRTTWEEGRCVRDAECRFGVLVDGRCEPRVVCRRGVFRNGRCVVPPECAGDGRLVRGRCRVRVVCPPNTIFVRRGLCFVRPVRPVPPRVICRRPARPLDGRCVLPPECREPAELRNGRCVLPPECRRPAELVDGRCELRARCPDPSSVLVGDHCEFEARCPANTTRTADGCVGEVVCPPRTSWNGTVCVADCRLVLRPITDECLDPRPLDPVPVDRHGADARGRGHRPDGGRGHDPDHNTGRVRVLAPTEEPDAGEATTPDEWTDDARAPAGGDSPQPDEEPAPSPPPAAPAAPPPAQETAPAAPVPDSHPGRGHGRGRGHARGRQATDGSGPERAGLPALLVLAAAGGAFARRANRRRRR